MKFLVQSRASVACIGAVLMLKEVEKSRTLLKSNLPTRQRQLNSKALLLSTDISEGI